MRRLMGCLAYMAQVEGSHATSVLRQGGQCGGTVRASVIRGSGRGSTRAQSVAANGVHHAYIAGHATRSEIADRGTSEQATGVLPNRGFQLLYWLLVVLLIVHELC